MKFFKTKSVFYSLLLSYILVLVLVYTLIFIVTPFAKSRIDQHFMELNLYRLEYVQSLIDIKLKEINKLAYKLGNDPLISYFETEYTRDEATRAYKVLNLNKRLKVYKGDNDFIFDFFLYYKNIDIILWGDLAYPINLMYGEMFQYDELSADQWRKSLNLNIGSSFSAQSPVRFEKYQTTALSINHSFSSGSLIIWIEEKKINELLNSLDLCEGGFAYILNERGERVASIGNKPQAILNMDLISNRGFSTKVIDGKKLVEISVISPYNGWGYVAVLPAESIGIWQKNLNLNVWQWILTLFLVSMAITVFFAYKGAKPLKKIKDTLSLYLNSSNQDDEYKYLNDSIDAIVNDQENMEKLLLEQRELMQNVFFEGLLNGKYTNQGQIEEKLQQLEINFIIEGYSVVLVRLNENENQVNDNNYLEIDELKNLLRQNLGYTQNIYIHIQLLDADTGVVLMCFNEDTVEKGVEITENIISQVNAEKKNIFVADGIGHKLMDMSRYYTQASLLMEYRRGVQNDSVFWFKDKPNERLEFEFSLEMENRFTNLVIIGNKTEAISMLDKVYNDVANGSLPLEMVKQISYAIKATVHRIAEMENNDTNISAMLQIMDTSDSFDDIMTLSKEFVIRACDNTISDKRFGEKKFIDEIKQYVSENYASFDLSVESIAQYYNLTGKNLSHNFKKQTRETLFDFIQKTRIEHAYILLMDAELSIAEVGKKVGFWSDSTFRRAFKQQTGVTAQEFRINKNK